MSKAIGYTGNVHFVPVRALELLLLACTEWPEQSEEMLGTPNTDGPIYAIGDTTFDFILHDDKPYTVLVHVGGRRDTLVAQD